MLLLTAFAAPEPATVEIAPGVFMPKLNLGTCCGSDPAVGMPAWFQAGGAGIDTAFDYLDETVIAPLLNGHTDSFITTKIPAGIGAFFGNLTDCSMDGNLTELALAYVHENLKQLDVDHVDLVLLHAPCRFANWNGTLVPDPAAADNALWQGLELAKQLGLTRAIGVSNYRPAELAALKGTVPAVNQCQMSIVPDNNHSMPLPWPMPAIAHDDTTIQYCQEHNITYEAWRVFGGCPFADPRLTAIAAAHAVTPAQVCVRWAVQRGAVVASGTGADPAAALEYSRQNLAVLDFALEEAEMAALDAISPQPSSQHT
jgi:diketogulonate reductase-like aldo/keto reductase